MLKEILITIPIAIVFVVAWFRYTKWSYRTVRPDGQGRIMMSPGLMSWLWGVHSFLWFGLCIWLEIYFSYEYFTTPEGYVEGLVGFLFYFIIVLPCVYLCGLNACLVFLDKAQGVRISFRI